MADPAWPAELPVPLRANYSVTFADALVRTDPAKGPPHQRSMTDAVPDPVEAAVFLTTTQLATFETFYKTTLVRGALPFTWTDPLGRGTKRMRFRAGPSVQAVESVLNAVVVSLSLEELP